jgi:mono/diheme cytochrome c family protein
VVLAGCGTGGIAKGGDPSMGKKLFLKNPDSSKPSCASCHTLADAQAVGTVGPNLDDAFAADRQQGYKQITIEQIVKDQIELAAGAMPPNLVKGQSRHRVAAYVASVAGIPDRVRGRSRAAGHLRAELRQLHAGRRGHDRYGRAEPRPAQAGFRPHSDASHQRRRDHACLQTS